MKFFRFDDRILGEFVGCFFLGVFLVGVVVGSLKV